MRPDDNVLAELIRDLSLHYGRKPTTEEAHDFIFGDLELRQQTWGKVATDEASNYSANQEDLDQTLEDLITYLSTGESDGRIPTGY